MYLTIGERLKDERTKHELTTKELCEQIGKKYGYYLSISVYNEMERDIDKGFSYKSFYYLSKFYNVSVDYLMGLCEDRKILDNKHNFKEQQPFDWYPTILKSVISSEEFEIILYFITELAQKDISEKNIEGICYPINHKEIINLNLEKYFRKLVNQTVKKFEKYRNEDFRIATSILYKLYKENKITGEEYRKTLIEYKKGHYDYDPREHK